MVRDELANRMSLFYAYPTPMLKVLIDATSRFVMDHRDLTDHVTGCLAAMSAVCQGMVENP